MANLRYQIGQSFQLLIVCGLLTLAGCGEIRTEERQDLSQRGVKYTLNDRGEVIGLYLYSNKERSFGDADLKFVQEYPTVNLVLIESPAVTDACLVHFKALKHLEELDLTFCRGEVGDGGQLKGGITDAGIELLQEMPKLKRIGLQQTRVTDAGADRLQRALPKCKVDYNYNDAVLAAMRRSGNDVIPVLQQVARATVEFEEESDTEKTNPVELKTGTSDLILRYISQKKSLESLLLRGLFTAEGLAHLVNLPKLKSLDIADPYGRRQIDAAAMNTLTSLSQLKSLDISGNQLEDAELLKLQKLTDLESLKLVGCRVDNEPVTDERVKSLKKSLPKCEVTYSGDPLLNSLLNNGGDVAAAVESVAHSVERGKEGKSLVGVEFRLAHISDKGLAELSNLKSLERLQFTYCRRFTDEGVKHIAALPNLKNLTISHSSIGNRGVAMIAALSKLQELDLSTSRVGSRSRRPINDSGVRDIATLKELSSLSLRGTDLSDIGLRKLETLEKLKSLDIRNTQITQDGLRRFRNKLPDCEVKF